MLEPRGMPETVELAFVLPRGSLILDWAGPAEAFRIANQEVQRATPRQRQPAFRLRFMAPAASSAASVGATVAALEPLPATLPEPAWVLVVGRTATDDETADEAEAQAVVHWLRQLQPGRPGLRLVTVCAGAWMAAQAGLLRGRRVTTHHLDVEPLAEAHPDVRVEHDRVFVQDGEVWSSAGVTCGIDLALHLVHDHCGPVVAARVAQRMAVALRRGPEDPQLSPFLRHRQHLNARLHGVQDAVSRAPREHWTAERMARTVHTTPRTLNRLFATHAGTTPLAYVRAIRVALARAALDAGSSVGQAAERAGFSSDLQLRRAWRAEGVPGSPSAWPRAGTGVPHG